MTTSKKVGKRLWILAGVVFLVSLIAPAGAYGGDPRGSMLVSQTLIQQGTVKLDTYEISTSRHQFEEVNGHTYYAFPIGTSLLALPFVGVANLVGADMREDFHEDVMHALLRALLAAVAFVLLFSIARLFLSEPVSLFWAALFWFGTAFASSLGSALFSHDAAAVATLIAAYFVLRAQRDDAPARYVLIGLALFVAYLCRPTLALAAPVLLVYLLLLRPLDAVKAGVVLALMLGAFIGLSALEYGQPLPPYYAPERLLSPTFWTAFYGNLLSPARGLFIYSPFLLLPAILPRQTVRAFRANPGLFLFALWPLVHLVAISSFPHWWGGACYGPRFMSDALPAIFVLFVFVIRECPSLPRHARPVLWVLGTYSVFLNTVIGLFVWNAVHGWMRDFEPDHHPDAILDWSHPQFLYWQRSERKDE